MYRCQVCKKRTEDIDAPPCDPADHDFSPQEIVTLHRFIMDPLKGRVLLCTGEQAKPGIRSIGGNYGLTCIRCKGKLPAYLSGNKETPTAPTPKKKTKKVVVKESSLSGDAETLENLNLPETENTDKLSDSDPL